MPPPPSLTPLHSATRRRKATALCTMPMRINKLPLSDFRSREICFPFPLRASISRSARDGLVRGGRPGGGVEPAEHRPAHRAAGERARRPGQGRPLVARAFFARLHPRGAQRHAPGRLRLLRAGAHTLLQSARLGQWLKNRGIKLGKFQYKVGGQNNLRGLF